jgi:hypothetical protein
MHRGEDGGDFGHYTEKSKLRIRLQMSGIPKHLSDTCLKGTGHFNKCADETCYCMCHVMDGEQ